MKRCCLFAIITGVLFGTEAGSYAGPTPNPPVVWSEKLGLQQLMRNRFRISDVNKRQNDSAKIAKFFGVVGLEGTPGNFDDCSFKARWNRRKMRVQIFEDGGKVNITSEVKRGAYVFQVEEETDLNDYGAGTPFFFRVKKGRKAFRRSPIHLISKRMSGGDPGRHKVTIIGN